MQVIGKQALSWVKFQHIKDQQYNNDDDNIIRISIWPSSEAVSYCTINSEVTDIGVGHHSCTPATAASSELYTLHNQSCNCYYLNKNVLRELFTSRKPDRNSCIRLHLCRVPL